MHERKKTVDLAWEYVESVWEDVVADIDYLVQVESVEDLSHATPDMPFGPAPHEALVRALRIADRLGLKTTDCDGYVGYADVKGARDQYIATIAHTDIVPLGTGWTVDPLRVTRREGYLLGRGVLDDKGPLVLSLYAAHFFARSSATLPYTLRCIIGSNEETGMRDVEHYLAHEPEPLFCFSPDASFPLICGEKGKFDACFATTAIPAEEGIIVSIEGGVATNAVPGKAVAVLRARVEDVIPNKNVEVDLVGTDESGAELIRVTAHGRGGHASTPEGTCNAIGVLVTALLGSGLCKGPELGFLTFLHTLLEDSHGRALGIDSKDEKFGSLTCVGGTVRTVVEGSKRRFEQTIDVRYPMSTTSERILRAVDEIATSYGCRTVSHDDMPPFYLSPDSADVHALLEAFWEVTGRCEGAFTIGGGTYSRHFDRAVAFGPDTPYEPAPDWVGQEHGPDEGISEGALKQALVTYIVAIERLMGLSW